MYIEIFGQWRWFKHWAIAGGLLTAIFYTATTVCFFTFTASARHQTWASHKIAKTESLDVAFALPQSCVGLVIDVYILILPIIGVSKLQMPLRRKIGVIIVFLSAIMSFSLFRQLDKANSLSRACLGSLLNVVYRRQFLQTKDELWALTSILVTK